MATTTHTPLPESLTPTPEAPGPRKTHRRFSAHHGALTWAAVLAAIAAAVALAVVTLTGGGDASRPEEPVGRTDSPAVIEGSDRHLYNLAEDIETRHEDAAVIEGSDRHLYNLAEDIDARHDDAAVIEGSDRHLYNLAEEIEARHDRVALDPDNAQ
jgi:hypothetical protein